MGHYPCPTCDKPLQKLKFIFHLKNCFNIDREEKANENKDLSSIPLVSSEVTEQHLDSRKLKRANKFQPLLKLWIIMILMMIIIATPTAATIMILISLIKNNNNNNNNTNTEELILKSYWKANKFYELRHSSLSFYILQKLWKLLNIDENNHVERYMSIKETKSTDITENPAKVKSNFD